LEHQKADFARRGLGVASISYDSVAVLKSFADRAGVHFPMLADPESKIIREFGILNEAVPKDNFVYGVPYPGTYILDEKGVVRAKYFEDDFRERFTAANILWRQFGDEPGEKQATAETPHLRLTVTASDKEARPGTRLALALEIELKPGMHVYAPGVEGGYIPVEWSMPEKKAWRAHEIAWPPSHKLRLEAIHETVPVYEGKFRLTRDLTMGQQKDLTPLLGADRKVTVDGIFRYQACDARECFPPQKITLRWTFHVHPLDGQRAPADLQRK
jgi:AhpC/TSA family/Disulphide bond corrector protein DsbC